MTDYKATIAMLNSLSKIIPRGERPLLARLRKNINTQYARLSSKEVKARLHKTTVAVNEYTVAVEEFQNACNTVFTMAAIYKLTS